MVVFNLCIVPASAYCVDVYLVGEKLEKEEKVKSDFVFSWMVEFSCSLNIVFLSLLTFWLKGILVDQTGYFCWWYGSMVSWDIKGSTKPENVCLDKKEINFWYFQTNRWAMLQGLLWFFVYILSSDIIQISSSVVGHTLTILVQVSFFLKGCIFRVSWRIVK